MLGAIHFPMTDIYGGYAGTTEMGIPEAQDQQALVDDQKAVESVSESGVKKLPIFSAIIIILIIAFVLGAVKR